jgi:hypothetical protein
MNPFERWETAPIKSATPEEAHELENSPDFYSFNSWCWPKQPRPVDGEIGYDDKTGFRIKINQEP